MSLFIINRMERSHNLSMSLFEAAKLGMSLSSQIITFHFTSIKTVSVSITVTVTIGAGLWSYQICLRMLLCSSDWKLELRCSQLSAVLFASLWILYLFIYIYFFKSCNFCWLKGKSSALGVGRGRAVAMRARVSVTFTVNVRIW